MPKLRATKYKLDYTHTHTPLASKKDVNVTMIHCAHL